MSIVIQMDSRQRIDDGRRQPILPRGFAEKLETLMRTQPDQARHIERYVDRLLSMANEKPGGVA